MMSSTSSSKKRVYILNGPPMSGKDTLAKILSKKHGMTHLEFKTPLYADTASFYGIDERLFTNLASNRNEKDQPQEVLDNETPRQALIVTSENVVKITFGEDHYGVLAAKKVLLSDSRSFVFSDGGFIDEIKPFYKMMNSNGLTVVLVRLHRENCNFKIDSRNYMEPSCTNNLIVKDITICENEPHTAIKQILAIKH